MIIPVKYPKTLHLPWSPGLSRDDRIMEDVHKGIDGLPGLGDLPVVVTEKFDGENTTFYQNYIHSRSLDYGKHPSRDWVKNFHAKIKHLIRDEDRICGENVFAKHSIKGDCLVNAAEYVFMAKIKPGPECPKHGVFVYTTDIRQEDVP